MPVVSSRASKSVSRRPIVAQGYRPAYAAAPAKYFSTTPTGSVRASAVSLPLARSATSTRYFDPAYPSRQFGSRLAKGYTGIHTRPSLHGLSHKSITDNRSPIDTVSTSIITSLFPFYIRGVVWYFVPARLWQRQLERVQGFGLIHGSR